MKKLFALPIFAAALALGACSDNDTRIFDESAADRLESSKQSNFEMLCADGGKWAMEYFANTDEPGYLFVMEFRPDKSVTITSDHKWLDSGKEESETSMFDVITDNGVVLTFNTYNKVFHTFSDPANITGPNAPKDPNGGDEDETGYGHEGDYEFMIMSHESTDSRIRLRGKKHSLNAYLVRLDPSTDVSAYLAKAKALRSQFDSKRFPTYLMTETASGQTYDITGLSAGVVSCVPTNSTNPFAQTESKACIITDKGMRPYVPFQFVRKDNSIFSISEFTWDNEGALVAPGVRLTAPYAGQTLLRKDLKFEMVDESMSDVLNAALAEANTQSSAIKISAFGRNPKITKINFGWDVYVSTGKTGFRVQANCGSVPFAIFGNIERIDNATVKMTFDAEDEATQMYISELAPKAVELLKMFNGEYTVVNDGPFKPALIHLVNKTNPAVTFSINVK